MIGSDAGGPLEGFRVLELADRAEMCGRYLADLGATVIKVEPPIGSPSRDVGPFHEGVSVSFAVRNVNKQSVVLDLAEPAGRAAFLDLVSSVDLWIESTTPGVLDSIGLSVSDVRARFPSLVVLSVTDFGQTGPRRRWKGNPWVHTAMSGYLSRSGIGDRYPLMPPAALPAEAAAIQACWASVVGLWNAARTGVGDHIDLSILEATGQIVDPPMGMVGTASAGADVGPTLAAQPRNRPVLEMYPVFTCLDGYVRVVMLSPRQWWAMRSWLGEPEDLMDDALDGIFARFDRADQIRKHVAALFGSRTMMEIVEEGQRRGVPCAPVLDIADVITAEHYRERQAIMEREIAPDLLARLPAGFVEYNGVRLGIRTRSPQVGEHSAEVLAAARARPRTERRRPLDREHGARPLEGIRVLDLGVIVYGAEVGRLFADLGADVIKVENRRYPDGARVARGGTMNANFVTGHRGKRSIGLNLRDERGIELFKALAADADMVLSNFKPGTLDSLGLGYETLARVNPRIVMVTSSAMGTSGPWSAWMGYGPLVRCASGLTSLWRYPDEPGYFADGSTVYPDHYAARVMATAGLAALLSRRRTGIGAHIEGAQAEAILVQLSELIALESVRAGSVGPRGNASDEGAPWGVYRCGGDDEWCVITVRDDEEWLGFCDATGLEQLRADPDLRTGAGRMAHRERIERALRQWTSERAPRVVEALLQGAGVPAAAMVRVTDIQEHPQFAARGFVKEIRQPGVGPVSVENAPFLSERIDPPPLLPAPEFGEHTREILTGIVGVNAAEVQALIDAGVAEEGAAQAGPATSTTQRVRTG